MKPSPEVMHSRARLIPGKAIGSKVDNTNRNQMASKSDVAGTPFFFPFPSLVFHSFQLYFCIEIQAEYEFQ